MRVLALTFMAAMLGFSSCSNSNVERLGRPNSLKANKSSNANNPFGLNVIDVAAGRYHTCAIKDEGTSCWGQIFSTDLLVVPAMNHPVKLSAGYDYSCALSDEGVKCWGNSDNGVINVPL